MNPRDRKNKNQNQHEKPESPTTNAEGKTSSTGAVNSALSPANQPMPRVQFKRTDGKPMEKRESPLQRGAYKAPTIESSRVNPETGNREVLHKSKHGARGGWHEINPTKSSAGESSKTDRANDDNSRKPGKR